MSNTLVQRLKALVEFRDDDTPVTRLIVEAALEIERLQAHFVTANAERETMAAHCRTIEDALKVGCVEEAVAEIERIKGENKTLRDTPVGVAVTQYRRMADERAHYDQECERLRAQLAAQKCEICGMKLKFHGARIHMTRYDLTPSKNTPCWCGEPNPHYSPLPTRCGGYGHYECMCGGDFCACHNHGEVKCDGCPDCEGDDDEQNET